MKYGLGCQLCDNSTGALFNDSACLVLYNDGDSLQYIDHDGMESHPTMSSHPDSLMKKIPLLQHFRSYMNEHLQKAGANTTAQEGDELACLPYLKKWLCTSRTIVLHLSNGTIQIGFFQVCRGLYLRWLGGVEVLSFHLVGVFLRFASTSGTS
nr:serine/threonine-protein kinase PLK1-like [Peromyscus maniculatus bairdii]